MDEQNTGRPFKEQAEELLQQRGAAKSDAKHWSIGDADFLVQDGLWSVNEWWPFAHWTANGTTIASLERFLTVFAAEAQAALLRQALQKLVSDLDELMTKSEGVAGLHLNGEVAPWESLTEGGAFGAWLCSYDEAQSALKTTTAGQALLDRITTMEEQVQQLTKENAVMKRRIIGRPDWRCMKCGHYASGSGQWACSSCGQWHTWEAVGDHNWDPDSPQGKAWLEPVTAKFDVWLQKAAALDKFKEAGARVS